VPAVLPAASVAPESSKAATSALLRQPSASAAQEANQSAEAVPENVPLPAHASGWALVDAGNSATVDPSPVC
jgi:hypothetical protein